MMAECNIISFDYNLVFQSLENWRNFARGKKDKHAKEQFGRAVSGSILSSRYKKLTERDEHTAIGKALPPIWKPSNYSVEKSLVNYSSFFDPSLAQLILLAAGKAEFFVPSFERPAKIVTNNLSASSKEWNKSVQIKKAVNMQKAIGRAMQYDKRWRRIKSEHPLTKTIITLESSLRFASDGEIRETLIELVEKYKFDREADLIRTEAKLIDAGKSGVDYSDWMKIRKLQYGSNSRDTCSTAFERGFLFWLDWLYFLESKSESETRICEFLEVVLSPFRECSGKSKACLSTHDMRIYRRRAWNFFNQRTGSDVKPGDYTALRAFLRL